MELVIICMPREVEIARVYARFADSVFASVFVFVFVFPLAASLLAGTPASVPPFRSTGVARQRRERGGHGEDAIANSDRCLA